jgi:uncharacterized membrane protein
MTRSEYLFQLENELKQSNIADAEEILSEYEQHFAFKLADGFTEEEIAAKLNTPKSVASQFESLNIQRMPGGRVFPKIALSFMAILESLLSILFFAWVVVIAAASIAFIVIGFCLVARLNIAGLFPNMPYLTAFLAGVVFFALAVLLFIAAWYFLAYLKQAIKASVRWHKNMTSSSPLPLLPWTPQLKKKTKRILRTILLWSVTLFGIFFMLTYIVGALQAGALEFWHEWNWFVG